jgi:PqqD family protein of HPr-rel-A system
MLSARWGQSDPMDMRWTVPVSFRPVMREWGAMTLVFHPLSGNTHFLDLVSAHLLDMLAVEPRPESELFAGVADLLELPNDALVAERVGELLARLDEFGLIEQVPAC